MSFLNNKAFCKFCYLSEDGICGFCSRELSVCLNCISYGEGGLCENCFTMGDEGICLEYDFMEVLRWIEYNDSFFNFLDVE
jgi:hypothetical protein